jgi:hypothetical protein
MDTEPRKGIESIRKVLDTLLRDAIAGLKSLRKMYIKNGVEWNIIAIKGKGTLRF